MPDPNINNDFIPHPHIDRGVFSVSGKLLNPRIKTNFCLEKLSLRFINILTSQEFNRAKGM